MSPLRGELTARGLRANQVLPFLLIWYGWLSREQGTIAKKNKLVVVRNQSPAEASRELVHLTKKGKRMAKIWLSKNVDYDLGYTYATYLRAYGQVSIDPFYVYIGSPLGVKSGKLDWYHNKVIPPTGSGAL